MENSMETEQRSSLIAPSIQVLLTMIGISVLGGFITWISIPALGAQKWDWEWLLVMAEIIGDAIVHFGWPLIAASIAFLAAGLVVLTIGGLNQATAAGGLRRSTVQDAVTTFIHIGVIFATLPTWGLLAAVLHATVFRAPGLDGTFSSPTRAEETKAFAHSFENGLVGMCGFVLLCCAAALLKATRAWMSSDEELVNGQIATLTSRIIQLDVALRKAGSKLELRPPRSNRLIASVLWFVARITVLLLGAYGLLVLLAFCWDWPEVNPNDRTTTIWSWGATFLFRIALPGLICMIAAFTPVRYFRWGSAPAVSDGEQVLGPKYKLTQAALRAIGLVSLAVFSLIMILLVASFPAGFRCVYLIACGICLAPMALVWVRFGPGQVDHLLALLARRNLNRALQLPLRALREIAPAGGETAEDDSYIVTLVVRR